VDNVGFSIPSLSHFVPQLHNWIILQSFRRKAKLIALASFVGMVFAAVMVVREGGLEAQQKGFLDAADMRAAKEAGIIDPTAWQSRRDQLAKQTQETERAESERAKAEQAEAERAKAEAERARADACERDLKCIGNEKSIEATIACQPWVERMAKNDFQWTDPWYEGKFGRFRWQDKTNGTITYVGDKIKFQNGFGAWVRSMYECDYNFRTKSVADVRVRPGQFPPD
jgi:hypothetical protein